MGIIQNLKVLLLKLILKHIFLSLICLIVSNIYSQNVFVTYYPETNKIRESYEGIVNNGDTLKDGWEEFYSEDHEKFYYFNARTNSTTWDRTEAYHPTAPHLKKKSMLHEARSVFVK